MNYNPVFTIVFGLSLFVVGIYAIIAFFSMIKTTYKLFQGKYDELERKIVFDSLAYSMVIIIVLHLIQYSLSYKLKKYFPNEIYIPVISAGVIKGQILGNSPLHFESFFFDLFLVSNIYNYLRYKYSLKQRKTYMVPLIATIIFLLCTLILFYKEITLWM